MLSAALAVAASSAIKQAAATPNAIANSLAM